MKSPLQRLRQHLCFHTFTAASGRETGTQTERERDRSRRLTPTQILSDCSQTRRLKCFELRETQASRCVLKARLVWLFLTLHMVTPFPFLSVCQMQHLLRLFYMFYSVNSMWIHFNTHGVSESIFLKG